MGMTVDLIGRRLSSKLFLGKDFGEELGKEINIVKSIVYISDAFFISRMRDVGQIIIEISQLTVVAG